MVMFADCHSAADKNNDLTEKIINRPEYASLNDSIRRFPDLADLYLRRAAMLSKNNEHEIALGDLKKAWELHPDEETGFRYSATLSILGNSEGNIALLQQCVKLFPANTEYKRLLGEAYVQAGGGNKALSLYDSLLTKDSADFEAWYEKGLLLQQLKDTAGAILALEKALALQPVSTYALELAHLYAENKNPISLKLCDQVIKRDSTGELTDPFFIKGIYYANTRQYEAAIVQFDSCIRKDWKFTDAYIEKGVIFFKQKKYEQAYNIFKLAATVSNADPDAYYWMGRCFEVQNQKEQAKLNYERAYALDKKFTEAGQALERLK